MGNSRQGKENVSPKLAKRCASIDRIGLDSVKGGGEWEECRGGEKSVLLRRSWENVFIDKDISCMGTAAVEDTLSRLQMKRKERRSQASSVPFSP